MVVVVVVELDPKWNGGRKQTTFQNIFQIQNLPLSVCVGMCLAHIWWCLRHTHIHTRSLYSILIHIRCCYIFTFLSGSSLSPSLSVWFMAKFSQLILHPTTRTRNAMRDGFFKHKQLISSIFWFGEQQQGIRRGQSGRASCMSVEVTFYVWMLFEPFNVELVCAHQTTTIVQLGFGWCAQAHVGIRFPGLLNYYTQTFNTVESFALEKLKLNDG